MRITLALFASLREGRFDSREIEVREGSSLREIAASVGLSSQEIAIIFVNGRHAVFDQIANAGSRLAFFPPVGGG